MSVLLAIRSWDNAPWIERFRRVLPDRRVLTPDEPHSVDEIRYIACWRHVPGSLARYSATRALFSLGAGVDHLISDRDLPAAPIVRVVDTDLTERMTEWIVLQVLAFHRRARAYRERQAARRWEDDRDQPAAREVRVGVMGLGVLGGDAIDKLKALRFDVAGWSRTPRDIAGVPTFAGEAGLAAFLARTDILVSLLPLTDTTRGILNARLFGMLAQDGRLGGPFLVNAGRGGLQVEKDILAALDSGMLQGAALDVFEAEPLPADSPLWVHPAVVVTPHNSAISDPDTIAGYIATQIRALESGARLRNIIDVATGY
jgi:glyoxylate/hydroxypyruvate reductase